MLIFLDIKTTGYEKEDKICSISLAWEDEGRVFSFQEFVNEGKKIPSKASAIHHITNEMITDKGSFTASKSCEMLEKYNDEDTTLIVHNQQFVLDMLRNAGYVFRGKIVDTLRVTRHLIPECELFSLQFLRYELKLYRLEDKNTQSFLQDVLVLKLLYEYLLEISSLDEMYDLSFANVLLEKFSFGKYEGKYIEEIAMSDRGYLMWLLSLEDLDEDLRYSLEYYTKGYL